MAVRRESVVQNIPGVVGVLKAIPQIAFKELRSAFQQDWLAWDGEMQDRFRTGVIKPHTGRLAGSLSHQLLGRSLPKLILRLFSQGIPYARVQEFGAVVRPVRAKMLALPGPDNLTEAGIRRWPSARDFVERHKKSVAFVRDRKRGGLMILWYPRGRTRTEVQPRAKVMFLLRSSTVVPGPDTTGAPSRLGFFSTWDSQFQERVKRHEEALIRVVQAAAALKISNIRSGKTYNIRTVYRKS